MKRLALLATSTLAALGLMAADAMAVPDTVSFTGRVSDGNGPIDGTVNLGFQIYTAASGGTLMWEETYSGVSASNGLVFVNLGSQDPLDPTVFTGADLYLQIIVNGANQSPRLPINSVPYAVSAGTAASLGTLLPSQVALSTHNHDASYAAAAHTHANYALTTHNHDASYAAAAHNHDTLYYTQAALNTAGTINTGSNPVDWTKLKSVPAGFADGVDNDSGGDILGITTSAGSGLSGGVSSGTASLSVNTDDFLATPTTVAGSGSYDGATTTLTLATASITVPRAGTVVAVATGDFLWTNPASTNDNAYLWTYLCTTSSCTSGSGQQYMSWRRESNYASPHDYEHATNIASFSVAAGTTTVYMRGTNQAGDTVSALRSGVTLMFFPN